MRSILLTSLVILMSVNMAFSSGFQINDQSARSVGMGFSTVATSKDASAIFYNPANITFQQDMLNFSAGASYIMPGSKFTGLTTMNQNETTSLETWNFIIPHFYANWKTPVNNLHLGLGVFVPFGLGTQWPEDWYGRHSAKKTYLEALEINPVLAYQFKVANMPVSVAAGFGYVMGKVELEKNLTTFSPEPVLNLKGDGTATTYNFGLTIKPTPNMSIGASYRHNIDMDFEGDTKYENTAGLEALFVEGPGSANINFPNDLRVGISYNVTPSFLIEAGINYVGWSSYDTLAITFDKGPGKPTAPYTSAQPRLYNNVIAYRLGAEYRLGGVCVRGGFYYDPIPVDPVNVEPVLPESDRFGFSTGFGLELAKDLKFDLGYLFIYGTQTDVIGNKNGFDGYYNSWANVVSLTLSYQLK